MAMPAKTVSDETPSPYAVNKALFEDSTAVKDKMKLIEDRLQKMEEHRGEVSDSVYLKVKTDYQVQQDEVQASFEAKCREIENELRQLYQAQSEQEDSLAGHQEILEEAKFRNTLGEYNDKKFKEIDAQQNKEIKKYNDLLDIIKGSIKQYEDILGHPFQPLSYQAPSRPAEKPAAVSAKPATPPPTAPSEPKLAAPPPPPPAKAAAPAPAPTKEEDTLKSPSGLMEEPEATLSAPIPAITPGEGFEHQLSDELDSFLDSEGDYFMQDEVPPATTAQAVPEPEVTSPSNKVGQPPSVSKSKPVEDSISTILRDIPLDDEASETVTKGPSEETGAHIDIQEVPAEASLLLVEGELDESEFILAENTSIGRSPSNDIVLKESKVSRQHASINYHNGNYVLVDLKSSNGVFVNGKKVEEAALKDGDEVSVGSFKFQFNLA